jgi:hypothetical protein
MKRANASQGRPRRLDHAQAGRGGGGDNALDPEAGLGQQPPVLGPGALAGAEQDQHVEVHADHRRLVPGPSQERLNDQQPARRAHRRPAGGQQAAGVVVGPVVEDP